MRPLHPLLLAVVFGLGVASGLFVGHEQDEELHRHVTTRLEVLGQERDVCQGDLREAMALLEVQQGVLTRQLKVLEEVCPMMRRAGTGWPWCPPEEVNDGNTH